MAEMTPAQCDAFLRETRIAKLATLNADGSPTIVPVWFEWTGSEALVFTHDASPKIRRIRRDPHVALSVEEAVGVPEAWVTIEGHATVGPGGFDLAERLTPRYYTPAKSVEALRKWANMRDHWVLIRITPTRVRSSAP